MLIFLIESWGKQEEEQNEEQWADDWDDEQVDDDFSKQLRYLYFQCVFLFFL